MESNMECKTYNWIDMNTGEKSEFDIFQPDEVVKFCETGNRYVINLMQGDGTPHLDPSLPLFHSGYKGTIISENELPSLYSTVIPEGNVDIQLNIRITPYNIIELLEACPKDPSYLKIDLDGFDGPVLKTILENGFEPNVIQVEFQPEIPDPIQFCVMYDEDYEPGEKGGFYGMSLTYAWNLLDQYGYKMVHIDTVTPNSHDLLFIKDEFKFFQPVFGSDFKKYPQGEEHLRECGINSRDWRYITDTTEVASVVWKNLLLANHERNGEKLTPFIMNY